MAHRSSGGFRWKTWEGDDYLGCCSYESEESFKQGGYYDDMRVEAVGRLNQVIAEVEEQLEELRDASPIFVLG